MCYGSSDWPIYAVQSCKWKMSITYGLNLFHLKSLYKQILNILF